MREHHAAAASPLRHRNPSFSVRTSSVPFPSLHCRPLGMCLNSHYHIRQGFEKLSNAAVLKTRCPLNWIISFTSSPFSRPRPATPRMTILWITSCHSSIFLSDIYHNYHHCCIYVIRCKPCQSRSTMRTTYRSIRRPT